MKRTKDDVVRAAGRLFAERGFHGTSMRDLGNELGLEAPSLYSHIEGKEDLLVEVIRTGARLFQGLADEVLASEAAPDAQLRRLIKGHVEIVVENLDEARTFLNEARFLPEPDRDQVLEMRRSYQEAYESVIRRAQSDGICQADTSPALAAIFVLSILNAVERWYRPEGPRNPHQIASDIYEFLAEGLAIRLPARRG